MTISNHADLDIAPKETIVGDSLGLPQEKTKKPENSSRNYHARPNALCNPLEYLLVARA